MLYTLCVSWFRNTHSHLGSHWNALQTCAGWDATFSFPFRPAAGTHRLLLVISAQTHKKIYPHVASLDINHPPAFFFIHPHPSFLYQLPRAGLRGESFWGRVRNCINYSCLVLWPQGQRCQSRLGPQQWCIAAIKKRRKRKTSSAGSLRPAPAHLHQQQCDICTRSHRKWQFYSAAPCSCVASGQSRLTT